MRSYQELLAIVAIGMATAAACSPPDFTIEGHDFHLGTALVWQFLDEAPEYDLEVINATTTCEQWSAGELERLDDRWFQLSTEGPVTLDETRHPDFRRVWICIGEDIPCFQYRDRLFSTSGGERIVADGDRVRVELEFTHEGYYTPSPLENPFRIEFELPFTTCN